MSLRHRFSLAANRLLRALPGVQHTTGTRTDRDSATMMEKLDAALNNMSHGLCMFGPDDRLMLWNDRYAASVFDDAPGRFLACLPLRKRMSISAPLTRTSSQRR